MIKQNRFLERLDRLTEKRRDRYKKKRQRRLKNTTPTIIGNDCVCGTIYRDLNLQYLSPTANVSIYADDFFRMASDLSHYLTCPLEESAVEGAAYPVGVLRKGDEQVQLRFIHDASFEEAKDKWVRRCGRVQWDNLYIVFHQVFPKQRIRLSRKNGWYKRFKAIPYHNKRMLLNAWFSFDKEIVALSKRFFFKKTNTLDYPTGYSKRRLLDQFDYVSFLNNKQS